MLQPKNRFKPMKAEAEVLPIITEVAKPGSSAANPLRPRPEDIPALVKSDVPLAFWVECTPDIWRACLALNTENYRPKLPGWISQLQGDMAAKPTRFKVTGDPIRFDTDGIMIDGQNRSEAAVAANFTFVALFVVGLPKDAREVIDFGRPRKISHVVRNMGYDNAYLLSATAAWLCRFKKGQNTKSGLIRGQSGAGTVEEILHMIKRHPDLVDSARKLKQSGRQNIPGSALAAIHYIGSQILDKKEKADAFVSEVINYHPKKSRQTSAIYALCYDLEDRRQRGLNIPRDLATRKAVETWNLFMEDIEVTEDFMEIPEKCTFKNLDYDVL